VGEPVATPLGAARHLSGFDGLRGIAVLLVTVYHFFLTLPSMTNYHGLHLAFQLRAGVWVFFVISGFLLYRPHAIALVEGRAGPDLRRYARSRVLRIWPAYAVALTILVAATHLIEISSFGAYLAHLFLLQNYLPSQFAEGLGPAWSLVVEVGFYAMLPVYAVAVRALARRVGAWRAEVGGLVALVATGFAWQLIFGDERLPLTWLPAFLPTFAVGMAAAVFVAHGRTHLLGRVARYDVACWCVGIGLLALKGVTVGAEGYTEGFRFGRQLFFTGCAAFLVLPAVFGTAGSTTDRALRAWPLHGLGVISYGVFLWNTSMIHWANNEWIGYGASAPRHLFVAVTAGAALVAVGTASWYLVERPALRLKDRPRRSSRRTVPG
jgi:peptidoglycan/LPS O-acetylase OafA/YrhL